MQKLTDFMARHGDGYSVPAEDLISLVVSLSNAAKQISRKLATAGLSGIVGDAGGVNVQGEQQLKLDVYANQLFIDGLRESEVCCIVASEEEDEPVFFSDRLDAKFVVCLDPLDGSANVAVNASLGSIFSVYHRIDLEVPACFDDVLQKGTEQVAAGYFLYGTSTMLVFTTGDSVNGFTLDPADGEFYLSHPDMRVAEGGLVYSVNEGNYAHFPLGVKQFISNMRGEGCQVDRQFSARYIGAMVADIHRTLISGGIYIYPQTSAYPSGKLRLVYECNPVAMLLENAGGKASNGFQRILEMEPTELHQRCPLFAGADDLVQKATTLMRWHNSEFCKDAGISNLTFLAGLV